MDIQESLMPREKMLRDGIETLSDVELLALFLRTGTRTRGCTDIFTQLATALRFAVRAVIG